MHSRIFIAYFKTGLLGLLGFLGASFFAASQSLPDDWAFAPLRRPEVPALNVDWGVNAVDGFVLEKLHDAGVVPSPEATKRELVRRIYLDVVGIPPTPDEVRAFVEDDAPLAYERLVDELLSRPGYGEKWARFWLDLVHFAETHGHDEDAIRPNAWPYRDYVVQALNEDRPYGRFVEDQVAGDVLYPEDPMSIEATGLLAAGPWDSSSQMGIQDGTLDKKIAQLIDRDDMVTTVMSTFTSMTVHCARCHDHKFDPVSLEDYYSLQAVFAGVDRADKEYDRDPEVARRRAVLGGARQDLEVGNWPAGWMSKEEVGKLLGEWGESNAAEFSDWVGLRGEEFVSREDAKARRLGAGGLREDAEMRRDLETGSWLLISPPAEKDVYSISGTTHLKSISAVRLELLTHETLPHQGPGTQDNGNLHLSEIRLERVVDGQTVPVELLTDPVADFNQAGWDVTRAVDGDKATAWGIYPEVGKPHQAIFYLKEPLRVDEGMRLVVHLDQLHGGRHLIGHFRLSVTNRPDVALKEALPDELVSVLNTKSWETPDDAALRAFATYQLEREWAALPKRQKIFTATTQFQAVGNFKPAEGPRAVHVLQRGSVTSPGDVATPGALSAVEGLQARFELNNLANEGERRAQLAKWLSDPDNPLTWRSIANRIWQSHFGRGIVETPNDFGKMGARPTHPELLDWLACELRDQGGSMKRLHKIILMSRTYRQSSHYREDGHQVDPDNRLYWRANLRQLTAEEFRDSVLLVSGTLNRKMGGPSDRQFIESKGVHVTPSLDYLGMDPADPVNQRRSIYRFIFRTVPDPFMKALNCADTSQLTPRRSEAVTPFQAMALMNNRWVHYQSQTLAQRLEGISADLAQQLEALFQLAYGRGIETEEMSVVSEYARTQGLASACRMILNSSEFHFVP